MAAPSDRPRRRRRPPRLPSRLRRRLGARLRQPRRPSATRSPTGRWTAGRSSGSTRSGAPISGATSTSSFWSSVPAIEGAVDACHRLHDAGFDLVCVSALEPSTRRRACATCATTAFRSSASSPPATPPGERSPKADAIAALDPEAFVDDYLPYLRGVPGHVHTALVLRAPNGSPNAAPSCRWRARSTTTCPASPISGSKR